MRARYPARVLLAGLVAGSVVCLGAVVPAGADTPSPSGTAGVLVTVAPVSPGSTAPDNSTPSVGIDVAQPAPGELVRVLGAGWRGTGKPVYVWFGSPSGDTVESLGSPPASDAGMIAVPLALPDAAATYVLAACQSCGADEGATAVRTCGGSAPPGAPNIAVVTQRFFCLVFTVVAVSAPTDSAANGDPTPGRSVTPTVTPTVTRTVSASASPSALQSTAAAALVDSSSTNWPGYLLLFGALLVLLGVLLWWRGRTGRHTGTTPWHPGSTPAQVHVEVGYRPAGTRTRDDPVVPRRALHVVITTATTTQTFETTDGQPR